MATTLTATVAEIQQSVTQARTGQRLRRTDADRRLQDAKAVWRASQPKAFSDGVSERELERRLAPDVSKAAIAESRARVTEAKQKVRAGREAFDAERHRLRRIAEPKVPATADETQRLLHAILQQNARIEARTRITHLTTAPKLFASLQAFEAAGDTWAAIETEARLDQVLAEGPEGHDVAALSTWTELKDKLLPQHRDARITERDQAQLDTVQTDLDAAEKELRRATDLQWAMDQTNTIHLED